MSTERSYRMTKLSIEVSCICNMKCPHCFVHKAEPDTIRAKEVMPLGMLEDILSRISTRDIDWISFNGWGEPLLNKDLTKMLAIAKAKGFKTMFYTNGALLGPELDAEILRSGVDRIIVSMDGIGKVYEDIRGYPYDALKAKINELVKIRDSMRAGTSIEVSSIVNDSTRSVLADLKKEWTGIVDNIQFATPMDFKTRRDVRCVHLWMGHLTIFSDGKLNLCGFDCYRKLDICSYKDVDFSRIFNSSLFRDMRLRHKKKDFPDPCVRCTTQDLIDI
jgi:wyosine [tRNA(Phe)-imidazoG37] synthetase (radical SAM superfamily)